MKALVVEDDHLQAEHICGWLRETWPQMNVDRISTECAFRKYLPHLGECPPTIVIMDVMLRWTDPSPDADQPPEDVMSNGYYRAGLRCVDLLRQNATTSDVPIVLYTVLERTDLTEVPSLPRNVRFLRKASEKSHLIQVVGSFIAAQQPTVPVAPANRDVFICHASEDRESVVAPLVAALTDAGITVWQDKAEIKWGDSLISKVEEGLRISRYVLAVLSKNAIGKPWPRRELHSALNREASSGEVKVLPLIVGSDQERQDILAACALQNDKLYVMWTGDTEHVVEILRDRLL